MFQRKKQHVEICLNEDVSHSTSSLFNQIRLIHNPLPQLSLDQIVTETEAFGKKLVFPYYIDAVTGGWSEGDNINYELARAAFSAGVGFSFGSQRSILEGSSSLDQTKRIRNDFPELLIGGNLGINQAAQAGVEKVSKLISDTGVDYLAIHLNPAQELIQPEGDRDFKAGEKFLRELTDVVGDKLMVKEIGFGIPKSTLKRLILSGIKWINIAGAGGTNWVKVEAKRVDTDSLAYYTANSLEEWGIPTAACLLAAKGLQVKLVASGGIRTGLDIAKSIVLGANLTASALPVLKAWKTGGYKGVVEYIKSLRNSFLNVMLLTGSDTIEKLREHKPYYGPEINAWRERWNND